MSTNLTSIPTLVESPFIIATIGGVTFGSYTGNVLKKANLFNRNHSKTKPANIPFAQLFSSFNKIKIKAVSSIPQKKQSKNIIYHYNNKKV